MFGLIDNGDNQNENNEGIEDFVVEILIAGDLQLVQIDSTLTNTAGHLAVALRDGIIALTHGRHVKLMVCFLKTLSTRVSGEPCDYKQYWLFTLVAFPVLDGAGTYLGAHWLGEVVGVKAIRALFFF